MVRLNTRLRLLCAAYTAVLALQSSAVAVALLRARGAVRDARADFAARSAALATAASDLVVSASNLVASAEAVPADVPRADAASPAPRGHVLGTGRNGRYAYADIEIDPRDGSPPIVRRVYRRLPDTLRPARFRSDTQAAQGSSDEGA